MTLVNKSLLGRNAATGRYDIHELLRQFGEQQLDASPSERESVHDLHCAYYAHYMQGQWKVLMSLNQVAALNEIRLEFNNVLAAWNDAIEKRKTGILRGMALPFWNYCDRRTPYAEAAILFERASEALQAASPDKDTEVTLGLMLAMQGSFNDQQLTPQGKALAEKSLVILRKHDCPEEMVVALYILAMHIGYSLRQFAEGEQVAQEALHVAQENHIQWAIGRCLFALGYFLWAQGDLVQARQIGEEGFRASEAYGELYIVAGNGVVLGLVALDLQDYARAEQYLEQGLRWCKELENGWESAGFCLYLGQVTLLTQDLEKAKYWLPQTGEYPHKTGKTRERLFYETLCTVSKLFTAQGRQEDAVALLSLVKHQANERSFTNPADYPCLSELANSSLTDLQASLPGEIYVAAVERGKLLDFDSVVAEFLAN